MDRFFFSCRRHRDIALPIIILSSFKLYTTSKWYLIIQYSEEKNEHASIYVFRQAIGLINQISNKFNYIDKSNGLLVHPLEHILVHFQLCLIRWGNGFINTVEIFLQNLIIYSIKNNSTLKYIFFDNKTCFWNINVNLILNRHFVHVHCTAVEQFYNHHYAK